MLKWQFDAIKYIFKFKRLQASVVLRKSGFELSLRVCTCVRKCNCVKLLTTHCKEEEEGGEGWKKLFLGIFSDRDA